MKIGIFSKIGASGGSEHRCSTMANAIANYTDNQCAILCENDIHPIIESNVDPKVNIIKHIFKPHEKADPSPIYDYDIILVVNSDSYSFAKLEYWEGTLTSKGDNKPKHHPFYVDVSKIPQMVFLFNFVVSPAQWLDSIVQKCNNIKIILANKEFYYQIEYKDKFEKIRKVPKIILESPIDSQKISSHKLNKNVIRIGKHSKAHDYKHNEEWSQLIKMVNDKYGDKIEWDLLGVPSKYQDDISSINNVIIRPEYSIQVGEYLKGIDIFCFFIAWHRQEPWARSVAEAMMAGCPIIATNQAGNCDQVYNGLNGYLCNNVIEFADSIYKLIENPDIMHRMRENNIICSREFTPEKVINKFMEFING